MSYKIILLIAALTAFLLLPSILNSKEIPEPIIIYVEKEIPAAPDPKLLTHAQETWISSLEWCESRGKPSAINPSDTDGTPSYYSFQFKPGTFRWLGEVYGVIDKGHTDEELMSLIKDTALQRQIVRDMIKDKSIDIARQFPGCVAQIGRPPVY